MLPILSGPWLVRRPPVPDEGICPLPIGYSFDTGSRSAMQHLKCCADYPDQICPRMEGMNTRHQCCESIKCSGWKRVESTQPLNWLPPYYFEREFPIPSNPGVIFSENRDQNGRTKSRIHYRLWSLPQHHPVRLRWQETIFGIPPPPSSISLQLEAINADDSDGVDSDATPPAPSRSTKRVRVPEESVVAKRALISTEVIVCPICLDDVSGELVCPHSSMHQFHTHCLAHWLEIRRSCPSCKGKIDSYVA